MKNDTIIQVYSRFCPPPSNFIANGPECRPTFELQPDGSLKETGEVNFVEQIQSYRGLYDVKDIVHRYQLGDTSALGVPSNNFIDNSGASTDLRDYTQIAIQNKLGKAFESLPDDIRSGFSDLSDFAKAIGDGSFIDRINEASAKSKQGQSGSSGSSEGGDNK